MNLAPFAPIEKKLPTIRELPRDWQNEPKMRFWQNDFSPPTENNLPKIRELSDFNEIFSVYLSINEFYNVSVILF